MEGSSTAEDGPTPSLLVLPEAVPPQPEPHTQSESPPDSATAVVPAGPADKKKPHPHDVAKPAAPTGGYATCLDRLYVQKELRWARQYGKRIIVVFEAEERRASHFDHGKAMAKYKGTEWEAILNIDAIPYRRDEDEAEVMIAKILRKADGAQAPVAAENTLNPPGVWDFFLSHAQATGGDQTQTTSLRLKAKRKSVWYDNAMQDRSTAAMEEGVRGCGCVVLFLTGTPDEADASPAGAETVPEPEPAAVEILPEDGQATRDDVYVAFREGGAELGQHLQSQLLTPHAGLPLELPPGIRVVVAVLLDAEAPLLKQAEDPLRQLLARIFHPDSRLIVVPVVDAAFAVDHFDGLPNEIRALARQQLVVMDVACPEHAIQSIQASTRHARTERISATLRNYLDTVIKETESFTDPCTQEELSTETQCVPLRVITLKQWSESMKSAYERSDASDLIIIRRRHGYGDSVGYADRLGGNGDSEHREADVYFAEAKQSSTELNLMPGAVILGPAACGKTTLLNRTACGYARDALCGYLGALVPYVIPVMELSSWLIKNEARLREEVDIVLEFICHKCGGKRSGLYSQLEQLFEDGTLCLIFDGLDEAGKKLQEIATCIGVTLGNSYSGRLIVSSRESLFDEGHFKQSRWKFLQIQPLTERMQLDVLQRRFGGDMLKVSAFQEARALSVNLLEMGSNPLLLALMIGVFIIDKNRLPDRRTELYEKGVQMMVRGASRNAKAAAAVLSALSKQSKSKGRGRGRGKRKTPKTDVQDQMLFALLFQIGHYLHVTEQKRDFQIFEIIELVAILDWGTVSTEQVLDEWTALQNDPRGLFMCTEVDPDGDGDAEKNWYRSTHLTFQEFFCAKQCVTQARAADSIADYFDETFTASPSPWLREVLLMTTELLSADEFEQVAKFYLNADDGSGACSVRVDQMLESRREDRLKGVGARITARLSQTRDVEMMAKALRHPCEELRDLALTEIEKFRMPKEQVAARLVDLAEPESSAACPWYNHLAGIQSLGKLQVKHEPVISTLIRIGLDRSGIREGIEIAVQAIKTLEQENSDVVAAKVVELLNGTPEDQQFIWTTVIKSIQIEHQLVIGTLRETMGSNIAVKAYLDLLDGGSPEFDPQPEPEPELGTDLRPETEQELEPEPELELAQPTELQQIAETRSTLAALGRALAESGFHAEDKIKVVDDMFDAMDTVMPGMMKDAKGLLGQSGEFQAELLGKLSDLNDGSDIGAALCWSLQETAVVTVQSAADRTSSIDEAQRALACIVAFDTTLRNQSTLVLGIALHSAIGGATSDDEDSTDSCEGRVLDEDPFIERLLGRLEASCPFAFSPLLHYFRSVLDPGTDPTGERGEALREQVNGRLQKLGAQSVEGVFLRKELQIGKYELEQPFWTGKIDREQLSLQQRALTEAFCDNIENAIGDIVCDGLDELEGVLREVPEVMHVQDPEQIRESVDQLERGYRRQFEENYKVFRSYSLQHIFWVSPEHRTEEEKALDAELAQLQERLDVANNTLGALQQEESALSQQCDQSAKRLEWLSSLTSSASPMEEDIKAVAKHAVDLPTTSDKVIPPSEPEGEPMRLSTARMEDWKPEGACRKQKTTATLLWPWRYAKIDGRALSFWDTEEEYQQGKSPKLGSSIPDVTGCEIGRGEELFRLESFSETMYFTVTLTRKGHSDERLVDLFPPLGTEPDGTARICFKQEDERDRWAVALNNVAAGRNWNDDGSAPAFGTPAPELEPEPEPQDGTPARERPRITVPVEPRIESGLE